jgi:hypothetical protein
MLSACVLSSGSQPPPDARALPPASAAGALFKPVAVPTFKDEGDDGRAKLAEALAALKTANGRIVGAGRWYEDLRRAGGHQ